MNWQSNRILSASNGTNPMLIKEMKSGFAVFGDVQFLPGYCVLLPKKEVATLNDLDLPKRKQFLTDMSILGDAIIASCQPLRVNYDILGNTDNYLHAHVFPRYEWENDEQKTKPVWLYSPTNWDSKETNYQPEKHDKVRGKISAYLDDYYKME